jgi:hypothetical protein
LGHPGPESTCMAESGFKTLFYIIGSWNVINEHKQSSTSLIRMHALGLAQLSSGTSMAPRSKVWVCFLLTYFGLEFKLIVK